MKKEEIRFVALVIFVLLAFALIGFEGKMTGFVISCDFFWSIDQRC